jgi:transmembrane sensor
MIAEHDIPPFKASQLEHEAYGWVVRFVSGEAKAEEMEAFKEWAARSPAHGEAFDQASKVWKALDPARSRLLTEADGSLRSKGGNQNRFSSPRIGRRAVLAGAIAASAAAAALLVRAPPLGLWPSWSELAADYRTDTGEQRKIALSGGVVVEMNTQTSIALRSPGDDATQIELISGEAMVQTPTEAARFTVLAADGRVVASRARFNVRHDDKSVCVTCIDGTVEVERLAKALPLTAGQQTVYSSQGIGAPVKVNPEVVTAWKDGFIVFEATPIADVITEINRYRHGKVILTNAALGREKFNARFRVQNIDRVVGQIELVFGVKARSLPGGVILLG